MHKRASRALEMTDSQRSLALYPGSFKPPHAAHLFAIDYLLQRPDVETVVIIISDRCRIVPGTTLAIDADSALTMMKTMLHCLDFPLDRIRIEVAEHRAVSHALGYFNSTHTHRKLLFCIGATDYSAGDDRYKSIDDRSQETGIPAAIVSLPTAEQAVRATHMRKALAGGLHERDNFFAALPDGLCETDKLALWAECRHALRPVEHIARAKICRYMTESGMASVEDLRVVDPASVDPVFRLVQRDEPDYIIKYAGESVGKGSFKGPKSPKPARRLAVEKRALTHVSKHLSGPFSLPEVIRFDRTRRILVLAEERGGAEYPGTIACPGAVRSAAASLAGMFLGDLHCMKLPQSPFWGSWAEDREHSNRLLQQLADAGNAFLRLHGLPELCWDLLSLGEENAGKRLLHLDYCLDNLCFNSNSIIVANFERSACYGDHAFDLARLIADYLCLAEDWSGGSVDLRNIENFLSGYERVAGELDSNSVKRMFIYAAFLIIARKTNGTTLTTSEISSGQQQLAIRLLEKVTVGGIDWFFTPDTTVQSPASGLPMKEMLQSVIYD